MRFKEGLITLAISTALATPLAIAQPTDPAQQPPAHSGAQTAPPPATDLYADERERDDLALRDEDYDEDEDEDEAVIAGPDDHPRAGPAPEAVPPSPPAEHGDDDHADYGVTLEEDEARAPEDQPRAEPAPETVPPAPAPGHEDDRAEGGLTLEEDEDQAMAPEEHPRAAPAPEATPPAPAPGHGDQR